MDHPIYYANLAFSWLVSEICSIDFLHAKYGDSISENEIMVAINIILAEIHRHIMTYFMSMQRYNLNCSPC